ncbi:MAG: hypothetical protein AABX51_07820 [Nanoarchaeota archaeon]
MKTIMIFGNEDFEYDNGAIKLIGFLKETLPEYSVFRASRPEQLMDFIGRDFIILDVAKGIEKPIAITDVDDIKYAMKVTAHDMDLASFLKILKEVGELTKVKIVAIPNNRNPEEFKEEVIKLIRSFE